MSLSLVYNPQFSNQLQVLETTINGHLVSLTLGLTTYSLSSGTHEVLKGKPQTRPLLKRKPQIESLPSDRSLTGSTVSQRELYSLYRQTNPQYF